MKKKEPIRCQFFYVITMAECVVIESFCSFNRQVNPSARPSFSDLIRLFEKADLDATLKEMIEIGRIKVLDFDSEGRPSSVGKQLPVEMDRSAIEIQRLTSTTTKGKKDVVGGGEFGVVFKAKYRNPLANEEILCAVKELKSRASASPRKQQELLQEIVLMAQFDHPNVASVLGCVTVGSPIWLVMPLYRGGSLRTMLRRRNILVKRARSDDVHSFSIKERLEMCRDIARGLAYLASINIVHRDVAARNILVDRSASDRSPTRQCFVADFGEQCND